MNHCKNEIVKQNWLQLASIQVGGVISLPLIFIGYELAKICHPLTALISILLGNAFLFAVSLVSGRLSVHKPFATAQNAQTYFGEYGRIFFASILSLSMLGWFAFQSQCVGSSLYSLVEQLQDVKRADQEVWKFIFSSLLAFIVIAGAFFGVKMLTRIALFCMPIMVISIGYAVIQANAFSFYAIPIFSLWSGQAISLVLAANIAGTIDLPTFYQHARNFKDTFFASFITYLIAIPTVQYLGACLYYSFSAPTVHEALFSLSLPAWESWSILFVIFTGWTTNNLNLYSASNSLKVLYKKFSFPQAVGLASLIGFFLVAIPMFDRFSSFLNLMGVFVVSMGSIILTAFILENYGIQPNAKISWTAWLCSIGIGLLEMKIGHFGTGAIVLDAGIIASLMMILINLPNLMKNSKTSLVQQVIYSPFLLREGEREGIK